MYKSPVSIIQDDYMKKYVEQLDNSIFMAIEKKFRAKIDRDELIKALNYDRGQYEKGFADGVASVQPKWIPVTERLPTEEGFYRVCHKSKAIADRYFYGDGELFTKFGNDPVTHWKPIEEPPKGDE